MKTKEDDLEVSQEIRDKERKGLFVTDKETLDELGAMAQVRKMKTKEALDKKIKYLGTGLSIEDEILKVKDVHSAIQELKEDIILNWKYYQYNYNKTGSNHRKEDLLRKINEIFGTLADNHTSATKGSRQPYCTKGESSEAPADTKIKDEVGK